MSNEEPLSTGFNNSPVPTKQKITGFVVTHFPDGTISSVTVHTTGMAIEVAGEVTELRSFGYQSLGIVTYQHGIQVRSASR